MAEKFLIENEFVPSGKVREIKNPYNNETIGEVYIADENSFNKSANYLVKISDSYKNLPVYKKAELLANIVSELTKRKEELALLITKETAKPIRFSRVEIDRAILTFTLGLEECKRIRGEIIPLDLLKGSEGRNGYIRRFPLGLILGITPWNFPVNLVAHKVSPALASGNVIMIKPSSSSLLCGIEIGKIVHKACKDSGIEFCPVNIITLSGSDMDKHVADERIKMVSFTGSSDVGWKLKNKTWKQKISLELGGNAGVILNDTDDMESAVNKIVIGGFNSAGQSCISVQRIYIHESIYNDFRSLFIEKIKQLKYGDPFNDETISGPMITEEEAVRAEEWIKEAGNAGAEVLCGGERNGAVLSPTVIENASTDMKVKNCEVFAPVVTIEEYSDFNDAVTMINDSRFGLQAGVFTNDMNKIKYAYNNIHTGGVIINDASAYRMDSMPYGGVKESGNSREGVKWAIKEMTEEKILVM
jgi:glyceraldehyde-3-phosphate dehydrogenase (NADP+)